MLVNKDQIEVVKRGLESKIVLNTSNADLDIIISCAMLEFLNKIASFVENEATLSKVQYSLKDVFKISYLNLRNMFKSSLFNKQERHPL